MKTDQSVVLINANSLHIPLADKSVNCVVTSPPYYGLRDYGVSGQIGLEATPDQYVETMVIVAREIWRVLRDDGTFWLNIGDSYSGAGWRHNNSKPGNKQKTNRGTNITNINIETGLKPKDLIGIPWRVAFALQADGWYLRSDIIWHKPNPMPESVTDRPTKSHEYLFLLSKSHKYYYDADAVREPHKYLEIDKRRKDFYFPSKTNDKHLGVESVGKTRNGRKRADDYNEQGRNRRTVWTIATASYSGAHFATYPPALVETCIKAGTSEHGVCPLCGAPWARVIKKSRYTPEIVEIGVRFVDESRNDKTRKISGREYNKQVNISTIGWRPTCDCTDHDPIPAVVFDPFVGSGTTLLVARQHGRHGVGCDLSYAYLHDQARERLSLDKIDAWQAGGINAQTDYSGLPMFDEV